MCIVLHRQERIKGKIIIVPNMMVKVAAICFKSLYQEIVLLKVHSQKSKIER